jgi:hypothetical protein
MAFNSYLLIRASGEDAPVLFGEDNTMTAMGGTDVSNFIECTEFEVGMDLPNAAATGVSRATGHMSWPPARFVLRLGKSTPWLFDAGKSAKKIELALRIFYQHHDTGEIVEGTQYRIKNGRISSVRILVPNTERAETAAAAPLVELRVSPGVTEIESMTGSTVMSSE